MNAMAQGKQDQAPSIAVKTATQNDQQQCLSSMVINIQIHDGLAYIAMVGRFDFQLRRDFSNSYAPLLDNPAVHEILVDMSKVVYLDSSAMGKLLLLKERAKAVNKTVTLHTAPGVVSQMFEVAKFSKIFNIRHVGPESRSLPAML